MRRYVVKMPPTSITAAGALLRVTAPSTMALEVLRAVLGKSGDATSEMGIIEIQRASAAGTSSGTPEVEKHEVGDPAATLTSGCAPYSVEPTLTGNPIVEEPFNLSLGYVWVPSPKEVIWVPPSGLLVVRIGVLPATRTLTCWLEVNEIG